MKNIIIHHHLFKNAGTSFDRYLLKNFSNNWLPKEFYGNQQKRSDDLKKIIIDNPRMIAISSHTVDFPIPFIKNYNVISILFIRHPIVRLRSVYEFEKNQNINSWEVSLAKKNNFKTYLIKRLENNDDHQCRNFHIHKIAGGLTSDKALWYTFAEKKIRELQAFGIVDRYSESLDLIHNHLCSIFPHLQKHEIHLNFTTKLNNKNVLALMRKELGDEFYENIESINSDDLRLYEFANKIFDKKIGL